MATNVFISYDHDDQAQVQGFKLLKINPNHPLEFHDHSLKEPVTDWTGHPIKLPPSDPRSKPIRDEIIAKFNRSSKLVVLIGMNTHLSEWVEWEVNIFHQMKIKISGEKTWRRIRGMYLKGCDSARMPSSLMNGKSTKQMTWDPIELDKWLDLDPDASE